MRNGKRSLVLTKICVILFAVVLLGALIAAPWLVDWLTSRSSNATAAENPLFLITLYSGGLAAAILLYSMYRFLYNIGKAVVFDMANVRYLRRMSWCCFIGALICFASGFYYILWLIFALVAATMGLFVRVINNMLAEAVKLKEENDFTI